MKCLVLMAGLALFPATAKADKLIYDCHVDAAVAKGGLVQPQYLFEYETGSKTARVFDGLIKDQIGEPVNAKARDEDKRTTFSWTYIVSQRGVQVPLNFTGTLIKAGMAMHVSARVGGGEYIGDAQASGTCVTH